MQNRTVNWRLKQQLEVWSSLVRCPLISTLFATHEPNLFYSSRTPCDRIWYYLVWTSSKYTGKFSKTSFACFFFGLLLVSSISFVVCLKRWLLSSDIKTVVSQVLLLIFEHAVRGMLPKGRVRYNHMFFICVVHTLFLVHTLLILFSHWRSVFLLSGAHCINLIYETIRC